MFPFVSRVRFLALAFVLLAFGGCGAPSSQPRRPVYVATVPPVAMLLRAVAGERAEVVTLAGGGASPHTYEPRPSDARLAAESLALFYVADGLDGWAARVPAPRKVALLPLLPEPMLLPGDVAGAMHIHDADDGHEHGEFDPHFWSDPRAAAAVLPGIVAAMVQADPAGKPDYEAGAAAFGGELAALDAALAAELGPLKGKPVVLFHLSMQYFLRRYELRLAAVIEPSPGKEATPKYLEQVINAVRVSRARVVFSEPQLPRRPAEAVAEAAGVRVAELDPYGGLPGRESYADLLRYNAGVLQGALK